MTTTNHCHSLNKVTKTERYLSVLSVQGGESGGVDWSSQGGRQVQRQQRIHILLVRERSDQPAAGSRHLPFADRVRAFDNVL